MNLVRKYLFLLFAYNLNDVVFSASDWWKYTTIYEIYLPSFKDSNGDGFGDLKGVTSMLDHLVDVGVETLWITPFFKSTMESLGYDVENYTAIEPIYGTMEDFEELAAESKKRGLKLVADFVINHSSNTHPWFKKSIDRIEPYTDFYVWANAKGFKRNGDPIPPNNWVGIYGGSSWTWNEKRKQFYYHQFIKEMPDLNLRNPTVKTELKKILKYWFDKGIVGGRLDAARHFMEDTQLRDEPFLDPNKRESLIYDDLQHIYTADINETYVFIHELREFIDKEYGGEGNEKILIPEAFGEDDIVMKYYGTPDYKICNFPFNFHFMRLARFVNAKEFEFLIQSWLTSMPAHGVANWGLESHDHHRVGTRINVEYEQVLLMTILMLPGIAMVYYGQEIGMLDSKLRAGETRIPNTNYTHKWNPDEYKIDEARLPMQWDNTLNAGFSSNPNPWLPVNSNYWHLNVEAQKHQPDSRYNFFKSLMKLRRTATLKYGNFKSHPLSNWVYSFSRNVAGGPMILVVLNLGFETQVVSMHKHIPHLTASLIVLVASANAGYKPGQRLSTLPKHTHEITLRPLSGIVFSTKPIK